MLPLLETFLELLLSNSFQCRHIIFFLFLKSSIFLSSPLLFWKQAEVIWSQIRGTWWVSEFRNRFLDLKLLDTGRLVSWSIVMVVNPITGPNFRPFSTHSFTSPLQYFHIISLVDCLALWNEFKVNNILDIKESEGHCLHL
jgi:hypothetical protein